MQPINFVVVAYKDEIDLLEAQAFSIKNFVQPDQIKSYTIIINRDYNFCLNLVENIVDSILFYIKDKVKIVPIDDLTSFDAPSYTLQQVAKLLIARNFSDDSFYVCLDSKNFFVRPLEANDFFRNGKPTAKIEPLSGGIHLELNANYSNMFSIPPLKEGDLVMGIMTPFIIHSGIARSLVRSVEERSGKNFSEIFCRDSVQSEFMLYSTYLRYKGIDPTEFYADWNNLNITMWFMNYSSNPDVAAWMKWAKGLDPAVMAIHRTIIGTLDEQQYLDYAAFMSSLGLRPVKRLYFES
ncbi:DUF6492 family protein [Gluconacetobacter sp. Hr-1-5]|uniref:DUF6492 family protein n=1 Tax=Gluconacetobacter sp. Hr-1-5 TaxID=3395370 RepID=UPI003B517A13